MKTGDSEVMDFSVGHGYRYLRILAGNEEPVCQFRLSQERVYSHMPCYKSRRLLD
jgi:hypothetical protein